MARKPNAKFSPDDRSVLLAAYENGMNSVSKEKMELVNSVAAQLGKDTQEIKNWIGNERSHRKRTRVDSSDSGVRKPPQKLRAPNPYNIFVQTFFQSEDGKAIKHLGDKNRAASSKWRSLSPEEKAPYFEMAHQAPVITPQHDSWREAQRILRNIQDSCQWAEKFGIHVCYMVCHEKNHYVGGTEKGRSFLNNNPHLPGSFLASVKPGVTPPIPEPRCRKELRTAVSNILNLKYALAVGEPHSKVPYHKMKPSNVVGMPSGVVFTYPSHMTESDLKQVYDNIDCIQFDGVSKQVHAHEDHTRT